MKTALIKLTVLLCAAGALAVTAYWLESQRGKPAQPGNPPGGPGAGAPAAVVTAPVDARIFAQRIDSIGTVQSDESIELSANVSETVEQILFDDGDRVSKGQILAVLSSREEEAALAGAEATLADHQREVNRLAELVETGAASEVRLQARRTLAEIAAQRIEEIRAQLADRRIAAPFDGVLGLRRISPGALITPGTVITTLDKIDRVKLDFTVPEVFLGSLEHGLRITARSTAYPGDVFEGKVASIDSRVDPVTRAVTVRARFENPGYRLRAGMLLTTTLEGDPRRSACIPERAVVSVARQHFAFVLTESGDEATVQRRSVRLGRRIPGYVEVLSGLKAGEAVVADGLLGLRDGGRVKVTGTFQGPVEAFQPALDAGGVE